MDASEFKDYVFGMMFLKRLSDAFDESREAVIAHYTGKGKSQAQAAKLADDKDEYEDTFFIPANARWDQLKDLKHDIGSKLNKATAAIEVHNSSLEGVLVTINFDIKNKLIDKKLRYLLSRFSQHRLRNSDFEHPDLLGSAYEYLIKMFAYSAGKKGGEFSTPTEIAQLMVALLKPQPNMSIYDPTVGSGGMLVHAHNYMVEHSKNPADLSLFGQEVNQNTWAICKMNMLLHGVRSADIRTGDTLREPQHIQHGELMTFDRVIANPPFSLKKWGKDEADNDIYGRFPHGTPPKDVGDLAFVQHVINSTNINGMAAILVPHGVLYRGSSEQTIRKGILENDLIEAIIGLPSGLIANTNTPICLLIFNKEKHENRKNKVLFIDASEGFDSNTRMNKLRSEDINRIVSSFDTFASSGTYCSVVDRSRLLDEECNLNIKRFVDNSKISRKIAELRSDHKGYDFKKYLLEDVALKFRNTTNGKKHLSTENSIYIPRALNREIVRVIPSNQPHHPYIQVQLDPKILHARYAQIFLMSNLGQLVLRSLPVGSSLPRVDTSRLKKVELPIASIETQESVVSAWRELDDLKITIESYLTDLSSNPGKLHKVAKGISSLKKIIQPQSDVQKLQELIEKGESKKLEFKRAFSLDIRNYQKNPDNFKKKSRESKEKQKDIETKILKTLVAFLNTEGGTLLIGVADSGEITGINDELSIYFQNNTDDLYKHFENIFEKRIGLDYLKYCDFSHVHIPGATVVSVQCEKAEDPTFLDNKDFYIRTPASSQTINGKELVNYLRSHFGS